ncbi:MAG: hypothetical protein RMY30_029940 [Nostoc sp. CmiSLP01]|nr:hypothetical protein [Nostoc sp. CmiSLP01]MDZ8289040.1 hypothetical protein [Nostoc sp. ChiSLP01]
MSNLSDYEMQLLIKLPFDIALMVNNYRADIINAAEFWDEPPLAENYVPEFIEVYYGDAESPHIFIVNGELKDYSATNLPDSAKSISVLIDDQWAYIEIEGKVILNRLGGVVLPDVLVSPSTLINSVLASPLSRN